MQTKEPHGRRNLIILGLAAISIAATTSAIELCIYRSSGDIYLDRSRPGYLPDIEEAKAEADTSSGYAYSENGALNADELQKYLDELKAVNEHLDKIENPYSLDSLSDESLGITSSTPKTPLDEK